MKTFDVTFRCTTNQLPTILSAVDGAALLLGVIPSESDEAPAPSPKSRFVNGRRLKGISARDLLLQTVTESTGISYVQKVFSNRGFSPNSLSPITSKLVAAGLITFDGNVYNKGPKAP